LRAVEQKKEVEAGHDPLHVWFWVFIVWKGWWKEDKSLDTPQMVRISPRWGIYKEKAGREGEKSWLYNYRYSFYCSTWWKRYKPILLYFKWAQALGDCIAYNEMILAIFLEWKPNRQLLTL